MQQFYYYNFDQNGPPYIRHLLAFSNFALGWCHCFLVLWWTVNSVLIMLIEDDCRECVDNNYLTDPCHSTAISLHLSSGKIVQNKFRKMFSKFKIEKSHYSINTMQRMPQWHKLDFKASGEMKVKSFKRKKVRKSNLKFLLYSLCCAGGHQKQI